MPINISMPKRNSKASIAIIESSQSGILYLSLVIDDQPYKVWKLNDMCPASIDFLNEVFRAYDLGYNIECQLPALVDNQRQIVPMIYNLNDVKPCEEAEDTPVAKIKSTLEKIFPPADISHFDDTAADSSIFSEDCGITDEFLNKAKKNTDNSPVVFAKSDSAESHPIQEEKNIQADNDEAYTVFANTENQQKEQDFVPENTEKAIPEPFKPIQLDKNPAGETTSQPETAEHINMFPSQPTAAVLHCINGHIIPQGGKFCPECGAALSVSDTAVTVAEKPESSAETKYVKVQPDDIFDSFDEQPSPPPPPAKSSFLNNYMKTKMVT